MRTLTQFALRVCGSSGWGYVWTVVGHSSRFVYAKAPALMAFAAVDCTNFPQRRFSCKSNARNLAMVTQPLYCHDAIWKRSMKVQNLKPLTVSVLFFALSCERIFIERHSIGSRWYRTGKYTVCRRVRASFSPEILQAGAVKGLSIGLWSLLRRGPVSVLVIFIFLCRNLLSQGASVLGLPCQVTASLLPQWCDAVDYSFHLSYCISIITRKREKWN